MLIWELRWRLESRSIASQLDDFLIFPVWEYALDEEGEDSRDETWVRPEGVPGVVDIEGAVPSVVN